MKKNQSLHFSHVTLHNVEFIILALSRPTVRIPGVIHEIQEIHVSNIVSILGGHQVHFGQVTEDKPFATLEKCNMSLDRLLLGIYTYNYS